MLIPEAILATLPLKTLLGEPAFKLAPADLTASERLPRDLERAIDAFLDGTTTADPSSLTLKDLEWIKPTLRELDMGQHLADILPKLEAAGVDLSVGMLLDQLVTKLRERTPNGDTVDDGFASQTMPAASKSDDLRFLWACRIAESPAHVIALMQRRQLTSNDVKVLKEFYPELQSIMGEALVEKAIDKLTAGPLPRDIKIQLSIYLESPTISQKTLRAYKEKPTPDAPAEVPPSPAPAAAPAVASIGVPQTGAAAQGA